MSNNSLNLNKKNLHRFFDEDEDKENYINFSDTWLAQSVTCVTNLESG